MMNLLRTSQGPSWDYLLNLFFPSSLLLRDQGPDQICTRASQGGVTLLTPSVALLGGCNKTLKPLVSRVVSVLLPEDTVLLSPRMPRVT